MGCISAERFYLHIEDPKQRLNISQSTWGSNVSREHVTAYKPPQKEHICFFFFFIFFYFFLEGTHLFCVPLGGRVRTDRWMEIILGQIQIQCKEEISHHKSQLPYAFIQQECVNNYITVTEHSFCSFTVLSNSKTETNELHLLPCRNVWSSQVVVTLAGMLQKQLLPVKKVDCPQ